jgi:hypothetical protein
LYYHFNAALNKIQKSPGNKKIFGKNQQARPSILSWCEEPTTEKLNFGRAEIKVAGKNE